MDPRVRRARGDTGGLRVPPGSRSSARRPESPGAASRLLLVITWSGLLATVFGFLVAYWAISRFAPHAYHYIFTSLGLGSAAYGFHQAFRTIRRRRISVGNAPLALGFTSAGVVSTVYGFVQAYRGLLVGTSGPGQVLAMALVTVGLAGAMYGFARAYEAIIAESRRPPGWPGAPPIRSGAPPA